MTNRKDFTQVALDVVRQATGEAQKPAPAPKQEGKQRAGRKGAKSRAEKMAPEERAEVAKRAAEARWAKRATGPAEADSEVAPKKVKVGL